MIHVLLVAALALFVLWVVGLASSWAMSTAWTLFVIACVLFVAWIAFNFITPRGGRRLTNP